MTTALTLPQRAAVALGTAEHEQRLIALVKESERITDVKNKAGRDECHTAYMVLKNTRISITGLADNATEDAKAFTKAVKAEALRLLEITRAEESRLQELRDAFDAKVQAEKDAKIAAERARIESIQSRINEIRRLPLTASGKPSTEVQRILDVVREITCTEAEFDEFAHDAMSARSDAFNALESEFDAAVAREAEAARQQAEREAAEAKAKADREELAAAQAKLKSDQEAAAAQQAALRAEIEKNAAIERAFIAGQQRAAKAEQDRIAAEHAQKMAEQQAAMDARQRDMDHTEGLMLNAQFDRLAAAQKLEEETATVAVVEAPQSASSEDEKFQDDAEIIWIIAREYDMTFLEAISRIEAIDFKGMAAAFIEESQA